MQSYLQRIDPARNMSRFYAIDIQRDLFGKWSLIRRWGRIGASGRELIEPYSRRDEAIIAANKWCAMKIGRGYKPTFY